MNTGLSILERRFESSGKFTLQLIEKGIENFNDLFFFIRNLPYGRNSDRSKPELILTELKGTCSTKHAFAKMIAEENNFNEMKLLLILYKMNETNTPVIGDVLTDHSLKFIPEAHTCLTIDDIYYDLTTINSNFKKIADDVILQLEISPAQTGRFKVDFHRNYIHKWIGESKIKKTIEEVWSLRELCIRKMELRSDRSMNK